MSDGWDGIPGDVFADILRRIPPCPRRRLRLVCRHWRDVIDERAPEPGASVTKVLAFVTRRHRCRAFVFDDLTAGRSRELDLEDSGVANSTSASMVGTCNGLLCLLRERGDIAVTNPVIGETVAVDPPPTRYGRAKPTYSFGYHPAYSFGYHPATGQYKIVHVPCSEQGSDLDAVLVLALGDGSWQWREVPAPAGSSCLLWFGLVTIGGVTFWVTKDGEGIMSFDLEDEQVAPIEVPPLPAPEPVEWWRRPSGQLVDVGGRLGLVVGNLTDEFKRSKTEVWVLEDGSEVERAWVKRYTVLAHGAYPRQEIALPHVVHGEHVLTTGEPWERGGELQTLGANRPRQERKMRQCGMVRIGAPRPETTVGVYEAGWRSLRTFAYAETREPLLVYGGKP